MKYSILTFALLAAPFASAQSLTQLPVCAQTATENGIDNTGCRLADFACICGNDLFVDALSNAVASACDLSDQQITLAFAQQVCEAVGVTLELPAPPASAPAAVAPPAASVGPVVTVALPPYAVPSTYPNTTSTNNSTNSTTLAPFLGAAESVKGGLWAAIGVVVMASAIGLVL